MADSETQAGTGAFWNDHLSKQPHRVHGNFRVLLKLQLSQSPGIQFQGEDVFLAENVRPEAALVRLRSGLDQPSR